MINDFDDDSDDNSTQAAAIVYARTDDRHVVQ